MTNRVWFLSRPRVCETTMISSDGISPTSLHATKTFRYLTYHEISNTEPEYRYSVSLAKFAEHARCLRRLADVRHSESGSCPITFDDGHISQFDLALPVLKEFSIKAIFFVTAGWVGRREGYMSWKHVDEIARAGYEVQSHGWSHACLSRCSNRELDVELRRSKSELESHLGIRVSAISAPGGRWNQRVLLACHDAGYERLFISEPWATTKKQDGIEVLGRWMVTRTTDENEISAWLKGRGAPVALARMRNLATSAVKRAIGDRSYERVWRALARKNRSIESQYSGKETKT
ncbi:MAG: putative xylanase/chitin deacetylase [Candidatus Acidoferrum typicum]|nr:putative xylanase/chitin deacetylase [Candidatus Acidoferrum typicum]